MNFWKRFFGHWKTIRTHRKIVRKLCFKCGLYWQGIIHDLSKYSPVEFWNGVKYFTGKASPHVGERAAKGYSDAWLHHHNKNKHHLPYWVDIDPMTGKECRVDVPDKYLLEMLCDRIAASMTYLKEKFTSDAPLKYYLSHLDENEMHSETRYRLELLLEGVARDGVDSTLHDFKRVWEDQ